MSLFRPRIIPVVLIDRDGQAVKTISFNKRVYLGDPINIISLFGSFEVDELILLDIDATRNNRVISFDILRDIASEASMPFSVGGGISTIDDIDRVLSMGAEKVVLSDAVFTKPGFLEKASNRFGSSTISVCINIKKTLFKGYRLYLPYEKKVRKMDILQAAQFCQECGVGEIIIQSVDEDGRMEGYDQNIYRDVSSLIEVPIVALGGAEDIHGMLDLYKNTHVSGLAAGSMFVFSDKKNRGVLVNYPEITDIESVFVGQMRL